MTQERSVSTVFAALDRDEIESLRAENARLREALIKLEVAADVVVQSTNYRGGGLNDLADVCSFARAALKVQP